ncbi:hypothetical protein Emag_006059 [Eimeria magna]
MTGKREGLRSSREGGLRPETRETLNLLSDGVSTSRDAAEEEKGWVVATGTGELIGEESDLEELMSLDEDSHLNATTQEAPPKDFKQQLETTAAKGNYRINVTKEDEARKTAQNEETTLKGKNEEQEVVAPLPPTHWPLETEPIGALDGVGAEDVPKIPKPPGLQAVKNLQEVNLQQKCSECWAKTLRGTEGVAHRLDSPMPPPLRALQKRTPKEQDYLKAHKQETYLKGRGCGDGNSQRTDPNGAADAVGHTYPRFRQGVEPPTGADEVRAIQNELDNDQPPPGEHTTSQQGCPDRITHPGPVNTANTLT